MNTILNLLFLMHNSPGRIRMGDDGEFPCISVNCDIFFRSSKYAHVEPYNGLKRTVCSEDMSQNSVMSLTSRICFQRLPLHLSASNTYYLQTPILSLSYLGEKNLLSEAQHAWILPKCFHPQE